ncbi:MAG: TolC family protein, partial [Burkholderiaceae bacterium]
MFIALVSAILPAKRTRHTTALVLVLCVTAFGPAVYAQPLSFDQALRMAQDRSRQLVAQDHAAAAAREMAVAAAQLPDPMLTAGINNLPINGPDRFSLTSDFMTMRSVGVVQEFTREDKRTARAARFEREAEVAQANRTQALANLQRDTALAWLDRYYQDRVRNVLVAQRDEARLQGEAADVAYRGARGSQADVFAARTAVAQIEDRIAQADRQIASATTRLARWIGDA